VKACGQDQLHRVHVLRQKPKEPANAEQKQSDQADNGKPAVIHEEGANNGDGNGERDGRDKPLVPGEVQVRCGRFSVGHEPRPGQSPTNDVGVPQATQRPVLAVNALGFRNEANLLARIDDPHSQLDVFDARMRKLDLVIAAKYPERIRIDQPNASPEGLCVATSVMMDEVMAKVCVKAREALRPRPVVIRSECRHCSTRLNLGNEEIDRVGVNNHVGVDEH